MYAHFASSVHQMKRVWRWLVLVFPNGSLVYLRGWGGEWGELWSLRKKNDWCSRTFQVQRWCCGADQFLSLCFSLFARSKTTGEWTVVLLLLTLLHTQLRMTHGELYLISNSTPLSNFQCAFTNRPPQQQQSRVAILSSVPVRLHFSCPLLEARSYLRASRKHTFERHWLRLHLEACQSKFTWTGLCVWSSVN